MSLSIKYRDFESEVTELLCKQNFIRFLFASIKEETKLLFSMFAEARLNIPGGIDLPAMLLYGNNILIAYSTQLEGKNVHSKPNSEKNTRDITFQF